MIAIVLMEMVHGIEAMALLPLYLTEVLGSSVILVGAVISTADGMCWGSAGNHEPARGYCWGHGCRTG